MRRGMAFGCMGCLGLLAVLAIIFVVSAIVSPPTLSGGSATGPPPSASEAQYLDPRELAGEPKRFVGQNVWLQGRILNLEQRSDYTWVQLMAQVRGRPGTTESVVIEFRPKRTEILRDECIRAFAVVAGTQRVTRTLTGATNEVPFLHGYDESYTTRADSSGCSDLR